MENRKSKNEVIAPDLQRTEILALDIATHTGYYSMCKNGIWNFTESIKRNNKKQHKDFHDTIMEFIIRNKIRQVVVEDVNVNNYFTDVRKLSQFHGILFLICDELSLPEPYPVNVAALKKWATGNGRADKVMMIQACKDNYRFETKDDNTADACHLYHYFIRKFRIN